MKQKEWVPVSNVIDELDLYLQDQPFLDFITFSGSGEPTLNTGMIEIVNYIKNNHPGYKICLLTNSTLLNDSFYLAAKNIDLIVPSMDAATEKTFQAINRPHRRLTCQIVLQGLFELRQRYHGDIHLEIMLISGINDTEENLDAMKKAIIKINPNRCLLGTLDRQGTESWIEAVSPEKLSKIAEYLGNTELIGAVNMKDKQISFDQEHCEGIISMLKEKPCSIEGLQTSLAIHPAELPKYINYLIDRGLVDYTRSKESSIYRLRRQT